MTLFYELELIVALAGEHFVLTIALAREFVSVSKMVEFIVTQFTWSTRFRRSRVAVRRSAIQRKAVDSTLLPIGHRHAATNTSHTPSVAGSRMNRG
jgi:hypothetical protein